MSSEGGSSEDAQQARRLMEGLLLLNSVSDAKGFVARGLSTDGKAHYPMGSNDQTLPWFYGLWRYWHSGPAEPEEKQRIVRALVQSAGAVMELNWRMPAEAPFGTRGSFAGFEFDSAPRQLFVLKVLHAVTGEARWEEQYRAVLHQAGGKEQRTRLEVCESGMKFWYAKTHNWTSCTAVAALRGLWELESDPLVKHAYARGLAASADLAAESLPLAAQFDPHDGTTFSPDWRRAMLPLWKPHTTEQQAEALALEQFRAFLKLG